MRHGPFAKLLLANVTIGKDNDRSMPRIGPMRLKVVVTVARSPSSSCGKRTPSLYKSSLTLRRRYSVVTSSGYEPRSLRAEGA